MNQPLEESATLYVLDRLDARERADFELRLLQDPVLAGHVHQLESALARRIHALPQHEPPADLLARIDSRLEPRPAGETTPPGRTTTASWTAAARWGLAAVIAVSLATIAVQSLRRTPATTERPLVIMVGFDSRRSILTELPLTGRPQDADARFIQLASLAEKYWEKPEARPGQGGRAYAFFDPDSNEGFIGIRQLPAVEQGKIYHLWILDTASGRIREAGVLPVTDANRGLYSFSVAPAAGVKPERLDFFVTAEDIAAPETAQPRGKVVLGDWKI